MYQLQYPLVTSLQQTIRNCSTETLTRGPAVFPSIPTSWTIYTCYSNLDCSHLKSSMWFFSCNSDFVPYREFPSYCQSCPLPSPEAVPACFRMSLKPIHSSISSKNGSKLNAVHHRMLSNFDYTFSSFLYRIHLQNFVFNFYFLLF